MLEWHKHPEHFCLLMIWKRLLWIALQPTFSLNFRLTSLFMSWIPRVKILLTYISLNCLSFGILLNTKTFSIKLAYTTQTVLFLTCKRRYNNDVSCFQDSTFASNAQWRRPLSFFQNGRFDQVGKQKNLLTDAVSILYCQKWSWKRFLIPLLFKVTNDAVEIQLKYTNCFPQFDYISIHHFSRYFITLKRLLK